MSALEAFADDEGKDTSRPRANPSGVASVLSVGSGMPDNAQAHVFKAPADRPKERISKPAARDFSYLLSEAPVVAESVPATETASKAHDSHGSDEESGDKDVVSK